MTDEDLHILVRGRNMKVTPELEEAVRKRFAKVAKQMRGPSQLEVLLVEERNPAIAEKYCAEATLRFKGHTLHAHESSYDMLGSIHHIAEDIRRQVKKIREKQRGRRGKRRWKQKGEQ